MTNRSKVMGGKHELAVVLKIVPSSRPITDLKLKRRTKFRYFFATEFNKSSWEQKLK